MKSQLERGVLEVKKEFEPALLLPRSFCHQSCPRGKVRCL